MNKKTKHLYAFDEFRLDVSQKCLWQGSEVVPMTPKAFDTLVVLVENGGSLVSKEDLFTQVWSDTFVEESTLSQNIATLRKIFNGKKLIETIPRRGYRFIGEVQEFFDDEVVVVEKMTQTRIISEREEINDSNPKLIKPTLKFTKTFTVSGLILIALTVGGFLTYRYFFANNAFENKFKQIEISKLVTSENIYRLALSPDGKYLAVVEKVGDTQNLLLKQTEKANSIEVIPPTKDDIVGVTFSTDSQSIFYTLNHNDSKMGIVYNIPILGGTQSEIIKDVDSPIAISPTEPNKIAFVRYAPKEKESRLIIADLTSGVEQKITTRPLKDRFLLDGISWSPDGKYIAGGALNSNENQKPCELVITNIGNGEQKSLSPINWSWIGQTHWMKDGSGILLIGFTDKSPNLTDEIWLISYPENKARSIANGVTGVYGFGVSDDGKSIIATRAEHASSLLLTSQNNLDEEFVIDNKIGDNSLLNLGMTTTKEELIVYSSSQQDNNADIWSVKNDGTELKRLTNDSAADISPSISADGKYLVFISNRTGTKNLWRMNLDGTNLKQLTDFQDVFSPSISPDGNWVYFSASKSKLTPAFLFKVSIQGGEPAQLTKFWTLSPQISPQGNHIACVFPELNQEGKPSGNRRLTVLSAEDGKLLHQFETVENAEENVSVSWTPDNRFISYLADADIWVQPTIGGKPTKLTNSKSNRIFRYAWLGNNGRIVLEKGVVIKEISLIQEVSS